MGVRYGFLDAKKKNSSLNGFSGRMTIGNGNDLICFERRKSSEGNSAHRSPGGSRMETPPVNQYLRFDAKSGTSPSLLSPDSFNTAHFWSSLLAVNNPTSILHY